MADKKITRQLSIFINGKEVKNSLGAIGREIGRVKAQLREANDPEQIKAYKAELDQLRGKYGEVKDEIDGNNNALNNFRGNWENVLDGMSSGNLKQIKEGLGGIVGNIKGMTIAALKFLATPIGAGLAAVVAIGAGVKKWVDYNIEIEKTNQLVRDITQESGRAVDVIRVRAEGLRDTFDLEINESVKTAKSLANGFGISYQEAFDIIEDGAIRGKLSNGEFLDSLKEYPTQFENAGFSAQEFADIVSTGINLSIYSDKLPDAIKEFNLAITEQTDASREALDNAFGKEFTNKLFKGLKDGSITAKDALAQISAEAERIGLNSQQAQLLTADLFKGAGEDAGGALKIFEAINIALNEQKKPLTEIQEIQREQLEANKELNSVYTQLFASGSKGFNLWIQKGKLFATETLIKILKGGVDVYNWMVELNNESSVFSGIITAIGKSSTLSFRVLGDILSGLWGQLKAVGTTLKGIFTADWSTFTQGINMQFQNLQKTTSSIADTIVEDVKSIYSAFNGENEMKKFSLDDFMQDDVTKTTNDKEGGNLNGEGLTIEDQAILDSKKRLKQLLAENKMQEEAERLAEEILKAETEEQKVMLEFERLRWIANEELNIQQLKEIEQLKSKGALEEEITATEEKYRLKREAINRKFDQERSTAEQKLRDQKAKADQKAKDDKTKSDFAQHQNELMIVNEKAALYSNMFGGVRSMLGETAEASKLAGIAQAGINMWQGITEVWKTKSVLPEPMATKARTISTGIVLASGTRAIGKIASTPIPFYHGGPTGSKAMYYDQYGAVTGVVHEDEWVAPKFMVQSPRYAATISWLEQERKRGLNQYSDGGHVSSSTSNDPMSYSSDNSAPSSDTALMDAINRLNDNLERGIQAIIVRDFEAYRKQKEIDEEHEQLINNTLRS